METCLVNLIESGDKVVICTKGYFGNRMVEIASRTGAQVTVKEAPWGQVFELDQLRETLKTIRPKLLGIVHAETSTGACQDISKLGKLCHEFGTLLVTDCVTSLGCMPVKLDEWEVDAAFSCTQKGLSCPPGLSPISFSSRAVETLKNRKSKVQSWYLDLTSIQSYWGGERAYHHTAPITMVYALREGLRLVLEEGLEARFARHITNHKALKAGLTALGLQYIAAEGSQLPQLNAVRIPDGVDDVAGRKRLLSDFGIEVGGGLGDYKGKAWRIGIMGHNSRPNCVFQVLAALEQVLAGAGIKIDRGSGVAAAERSYAG
jgi:alanine-glyoxylate transaminase/serine-glyoxylate transaminase/serine-pyruvate transaminase